MRGRTTGRGGALGAARPAFSLLEITLVLVIIGLLMGVAAVNLLGQAERARKSTTEATMTNYKTQITSYMATNSSPPPDLMTLVTGKYLEPEPDGVPPRDAWKQALYYLAQPDAQGHPFQLISAGPDKEFNTPDDINLWQIGLDQGG